MMSYDEAMSRSHRVTTKYRHYGPLYDLVAATLPPAPTVLEVGIANGGSLETWRTLFGPEARIIGVDLNERTVALREDGFEIFLLDTGDPASWNVLRSELAGQVDLLVDDGGHTNRQQVEAILGGIDLIRPGGWIVVEDLHASFMAEFGNPNPHSAVAFLNDLASDLHRAHPRSQQAPHRPNLAHVVDHMITATSWAALRVAPWEDDSRDEVTAGSDDSLMDYDHRWDDQAGARRLGRLLPKPVARAARDVALRVSETTGMRGRFRSDVPSPKGSRPGR